MTRVPPSRLRLLHDAPLRPDAGYVLYWMTAFRRTAHNFALDRALALSTETGRPLAILEPLRVGYRWASDRVHRFVLDGMGDQAEACAAAGVTYLPYVEPTEGAGKGLLEALAQDAVAVVADDSPAFFYPRIQQAAAAQLGALGVRLEAVDSNGLYPLRDTDRIFTRAHSFRRHLQKRLPSMLGETPSADPFAGYDRGPATIAAGVTARWPELGAVPAGDDLSAYPIDHDVAPTGERGGRASALARLDGFMAERFDQYGVSRNHPDENVASGLSPYLHFGFVSTHEMFARIADREGWSPDKLNKPNGSREGYWSMGPAAESFLDELITWREVGYNMAALDPDNYRRFASLPGWALTTLQDHARDRRPYLYSAEALELGHSHDPLWNAAQRQLVTEGRIHNYLRMLWGKKILEWSETPQDALDVLVHLNNKYALDGRDPSSYSGIFWVLGRYDRAWGPERPIFGKVRYMSSDSAAKKLRLKGYVERYGPPAAQAELFEAR